MKTKVGINGFGRIGRLELKIPFQNDIDATVIDNLDDTKTNAHVFKLDSVYGRYSGEVSATDRNDMIIVADLAEDIYKPLKYPGTPSSSGHPINGITPMVNMLFENSSIVRNVIKTTKMHYIRGTLGEMAKEN
jgi:hypothetical protein